MLEKLHIRRDQDVVDKHAKKGSHLICSYFGTMVFGMMFLSSISRFLKIAEETDYEYVKGTFLIKLLEIGIELGMPEVIFILMLIIIPFVCIFCLLRIFLWLLRVIYPNWRLDNYFMKGDIWLKEDGVVFNSEEDFVMPWNTFKSHKVTNGKDSSSNLVLTKKDGRSKSVKGIINAKDVDDFVRSKIMIYKEEDVSNDLKKDSTKDNQAVSIVAVYALSFFGAVCLSTCGLKYVGLDEYENTVLNHFGYMCLSLGLGVLLVWLGRKIIKSIFGK